MKVSKSTPFQLGCKTQLIAEAQAHDGWDPQGAEFIN
jgi:hypothetical protein